MPIQMTWLYDRRIVSIRHYGKVTSQELIASFIDLEPMVAAGIRPVHVYVNSSETEGRPEVALGDLRRIVPKVLDGLGWMVVVQPRTFERFFTSLGMQISGAKYKFVADETAAMQFLMEHDPTLQDVITLDSSKS
jgi:hypothetical protein